MFEPSNEQVGWHNTLFKKRKRTRRIFQTLVAIKNNPWTYTHARFSCDTRVSLTQLVRPRVDTPVFSEGYWMQSQFVWGELHTNFKLINFLFSEIQWKYYLQKNWYLWIVLKTISSFNVYLKTNKQWKLQNKQQITIFSSKIKKTILIKSLSWFQVTGFSHQNI